MTSEEDRPILLDPTEATSSTTESTLSTIDADVVREHAQATGDQAEQIPTPTSTAQRSTSTSAPVQPEGLSQTAIEFFGISSCSEEAKAWMCISHDEGTAIVYPSTDAERGLAKSKASGLYDPCCSVLFTDEAGALIFVPDLSEGFPKLLTEPDPPGIATVDTDCLGDGASDPFCP